MKISELIQNLEEIKEEHGDLPIMIVYIDADGNFPLFFEKSFLSVEQYPTYVEKLQKFQGTHPALQISTEQVDLTF